MANHRAQRIERPCDNCGSVLLLLPCRVRQIRKHVYCSQRCSRGKQGTSKRPFEWLYNRLRRAAAERSIPCELTYEQFASFTSITICHYCDATVEWSEYASERSERQRSTYNLDRKNSDIGYTEQNLVVCCSRCNCSKGDRFTYQEWLKIGEIIRGFSK